MEGPGTDSHRRRWSWKRKLLLQIALLPLWLFAAELAYRGWLWTRGTPYDAEQTSRRIRTLFTATDALAPTVDEHGKEIDAESARFFRVWHPHPFYGFDDFQSPPAMQNDIAAFLGPRDPNELTILLVGGSVAWLFQPEGTDALRTKLLADPRFAGRRIRFLNYARPAFKEPQQLMLVAYFLDLGIKPDIVLNLDGFNEAAFAWSNIQANVDPVYPDFAIWAHTVRSGISDRHDLDILLDIREMQLEVSKIAKFAIGHDLCASALLGRMTLSRLTWRASHAANRRQEYLGRLAGDPTKDMHGPVRDGGTEAGIEAAVRNWRESSRSIQALCADRAILYLHVLQPTLYDTGSKPLTAQEISTQGDNAYFVDGVHRIYPLLKKAGEELRAHGVNFRDESMCFADVTDTVYYDHCHFRGLGNEIVATRIAEALLASWPKAGGASPGPRATLNARK